MEKLLYCSDIIQIDLMLKHFIDWFIDTVEYFYAVKSQPKS